MTDTKKNSALADPVPAKMTADDALLKYLATGAGFTGSTAAATAHDAFRKGYTFALSNAAQQDEGTDYECPDCGKLNYRPLDCGECGRVYVEAPQQAAGQARELPEAGGREAEKLACILFGMCEGGGEDRDTDIYADDYQAGDGDVYVTRAAQLLIEQAAEIRELVRYVDAFGSMVAAQSAPAVPDEREAFEKRYSVCDLSKKSGAWGEAIYVHSHVQALWDGWKARASLASAPAQPTVPEGFALVPRKATADMIRAAFAWRQSDKVAGLIGDADMYERIYYAMISAAPAQSAPAQPTVPAGFALVPIEPTQEMMQAGFDVVGGDRYGLMWRAMIAAAAPAAQKGEKG